MGFVIWSSIWSDWFSLLIVIILSALVYKLYRAQTHHLLMMERIRRQIATDLHDDIGSGLAQIAILSEVAKREAPSTIIHLLDATAHQARTIREAMSDLVWTIDPQQDRLTDLVQRLRQVLYNLFETNGLRVDFHAPESAELDRVVFVPEQRRHLLLICKEATTNIARHGRASHIQVNLWLAAGQLHLVIQDNGSGFDPHASYHGHGLRSLKQRAAELRAYLTIESTPGGGGTLIKLIVPLRNSGP